MSISPEANRPVAWVTGAGGMIGSYLIRATHQYATAWEVKALARPDLDLTDFQAVRERFQKDRPALVIHCAAMTRTPECQSNPGIAHKLNVELTAHLAELAKDIPFFFFSSDMVFDGHEPPAQFARGNTHQEQARTLRGELIEGELAEQKVLAGSCEAGAPVLAECHIPGQRKGHHIGSIMDVALALPVAGERPVRPDEFEIKAADPGELRAKATGFVVETGGLVA